MPHCNKVDYAAALTLLVIKLFWSCALQWSPGQLRGQFLDCSKTSSRKCMWLKPILCELQIRCMSHSSNSVGWVLGLACRPTFANRRYYFLLLTFLLCTATGWSRVPTLGRRLSTHTLSWFQLSLAFSSPCMLVDASLTNIWNKKYV